MDGIDATVRAVGPGIGLSPAGRPATCGGESPGRAVRAARAAGLLLAGPPRRVRASTASRRGQNARGAPAVRGASNGSVRLPRGAGRDEPARDAARPNDTRQRPLTRQELSGSAHRADVWRSRPELHARRHASVSAPSAFLAEIDDEIASSSPHLSPRKPAAGQLALASLGGPGGTRLTTGRGDVAHGLDAARDEAELLAVLDIAGNDRWLCL